MNTSSPFETKHLASAEVGELVCIPFADCEPTWAIVLLKNGDGSVSLAALRSGIPELECPTLTNLDGYRVCLSFGSNWIFEVVVDADTHDFVNIHHAQERGAWLVRGETVALRFGKNERELMSGAFLDMRTLTSVGPLQGDGVYGTRWRLWGSEGEKARPNGKPLLVSNPTAV